MSICMGYSSFVAMPRISVSRVLDHNFKTKTTLDGNNNRLFRFLRTLHVFHGNFIEFGCGRILHHFATVSRFAVHEIKRFQKSAKFTWRMGDEIKVKILLLFKYLEVILCALFEFGSKHLISWALNIDFDREMTLSGKENLTFSFSRPCQAFHVNFTKFGHFMCFMGISLNSDAIKFCTTSESYQDLQCTKLNDFKN